MHRLAPPLQEMNVSLVGSDFGSGAGQKAEVPVNMESRKVCCNVVVHAATQLLLFKGVH